MLRRVMSKQRRACGRRGSKNARSDCIVPAEHCPGSFRGVLRAAPQVGRFLRKCRVCGAGRLGDRSLPGRTLRRYLEAYLRLGQNEPLLGEGEASTTDPIAAFRLGLGGG